jgi:hypothetical protein
MPPQASEVFLPPLKGYLPKPRPIVNRRGPDVPHKTSAAYLEATSRRASRRKLDQAARSERGTWHVRMASSRRVALREGLTGLWARKQKLDAATISRLQIKSQRNVRAALGPERAVDVLTRPTTRAATALETSAPPDPERFAKAWGSAARTAARQQMQRDLRRDAVTQLYVMARDFIVTEEQLQAKVDKLFAEEYWSKKTIGGGLDTGNIWGAEEAPLTVAQQLSDHMQVAARRNRSDTPNSGGGLVTSELHRTAEKQKVVAEELTGGSMDV